MFSLSATIHFILFKIWYGYCPLRPRQNLSAKYLLSTTVPTPMLGMPYSSASRERSGNDWSILQRRHGTLSQEWLGGGQYGLDICSGLSLESTSFYPKDRLKRLLKTLNTTWF